MWYYGGLEGWRLSRERYYSLGIGLEVGRILYVGVEGEEVDEVKGVDFVELWVYIRYFYLYLVGIENLLKGWCCV